MSFSLLRTNVALTTNLKIVVSSQDQLYLESIDSNEYLTADQFKKKLFNPKTPMESLVPAFFQDLELKYVYDIKYDEDNENAFERT